MLKFRLLLFLSFYAQVEAQEHQLKTQQTQLKKLFQRSQIIVDPTGKVQAGAAECASTSPTTHGSCTGPGGLYALVHRLGAWIGLPGWKCFCAGCHPYEWHSLTRQETAPL